VLNSSLPYEAPGKNWSLQTNIRKLGNEVLHTPAIKGAFRTGIESASINPPHTFFARQNLKF
jgi:hypothetical protein